MTIKNNAKYNPSQHFKDLVSAASQYIKADLGVSYNDRILDMTSTNMHNASEGATGRAKDLGKGISKISQALSGGSNSETYFIMVNGSLYRCSIPHGGKAPNAYQVCRSR